VVLQWFGQESISHLVSIRHQAIPHLIQLTQVLKILLGSYLDIGLREVLSIWLGLTQWKTKRLVTFSTSILHNS
jgi:hypothetical protein